MKHTPITVALDKLVVSKDNARKRYEQPPIVALAANINSEGLLQPLLVRAQYDDAGAATGFYEVVAGERRRRALKILSRRPGLKRNAPISCLELDSRTNSMAVSLSENTLRVAMHPAEEFRAFNALAIGGMSIADIAARFGTTERLVEQRLRLANVAVPILAAYEKGQINLDVVIAFAAEPDIERQAEFFAANKGGYLAAAHIRRTFTAGRMATSLAVVALVGLDAYTAAGGTITSDLFGDEAWIDNPEVIDALAKPIIDAKIAELLADGWKWVELATEDRRIYNFERVHCPSETERAGLGCFITISPEGELKVREGFVAEEDVKERKRATQAAKRTHMALAAKTADPKGQSIPFSAKTVEALAEGISRATGKALVENPIIALRAVVYSLVWSKLNRYSIDTPVPIRCSSDCPPDAFVAVFGDSVPTDAVNVWKWASTTSLDSLLLALAIVTQDGFAAKYEPGSNDWILVNELAVACGVEPGAGWVADEAFFAGLRKAPMLAILTEACGPDVADNAKNLKHAELVARCVRMVGATDWKPQHTLLTNLFDTLPQPSQPDADE